MLVRVRRASLFLQRPRRYLLTYDVVDMTLTTSIGTIKAFKNVNKQFFNVPVFFPHSALRVTSFTSWIAVQQRQRVFFEVMLIRDDMTQTPRGKWGRVWFIESVIGVHTVKNKYTSTVKILNLNHSIMLFLLFSRVLKCWMVANRLSGFKKTRWK